MSKWIRRCCLFAVVAAAGLAALNAPASAAEADEDAPRTGSLKTAWVGFELTPVSVSLPSSCCYDRPGHVDRFQAGPGASVRVLRHRWEQLYVIPIQAGLYVSSQNRTLFAHIEAEGGLIVPATDRRLELGIGMGVGFLRMHYADGCDGGCDVGGGGWLVSFVARYLLVDGPTFSMGVNTRLVVPLEASGDVGYFLGRGNILLGGLEVSFGRA